MLWYFFRISFFLFEFWKISKEHAWWLMHLTRAFRGHTQIYVFWAYRDLTQQGCKSFCYVWFLALLECCVCAMLHRRKYWVIRREWPKKASLSLLKLKSLYIHTCSWKKEQFQIFYSTEKRGDFLITFTNSSGKSHLQYYNLTFAAFFQISFI